MTTTAALTKAVFKGLLRAGRRLDAAGATAAQRGAVPLPTAAALGAAAASAPSAVAAARVLFRAPPAGATLNDALAALPRANALVAALLAPPAPLVAAASPRAAPHHAEAAALAPAAGAYAHDDDGAAAAVRGADPVPLRVGHVFRHAKHGYRAVIVGHDDRCRAGDAWVATTGAAGLPHGTRQSFYYALVDVRDRPGASIAYVAADHVAPPRQPQQQQQHRLDAAAADGGGVEERVVVHPLVPAYFASYDDELRAFVPLPGGAVVGGSNTRGAAAAH